MRTIKFIATITIIDFVTWDEIYKKYESRHLRIKLTNDPLFLTLFGIEIIENNESEIIVEGEVLLSDEEKNNYPIIENHTYDFVFQEGKILLGKLTFLDFEI